jgi:hypothetical protein
MRTDNDRMNFMYLASGWWSIMLWLSR